MKNKKTKFLRLNEDWDWNCNCRMVWRTDQIAQYFSWRDCNKLSLSFVKSICCDFSCLRAKITRRASYVYRHRWLEQMELWLANSAKALVIENWNLSITVQCWHFLQIFEHRHNQQQTILNFESETTKRNEMSKPCNDCLDNRDKNVQKVTWRLNRFRCLKLYIFKQLWT